MKILILGGYGTFGGRLARLLDDHPGLTLIIAGRSESSAASFCSKLAGRAKAVPMRFDRDGDVESQLRAVGADIVVDATGPFQGYGEDPYRLVKAALAVGCNYLDLADGSDFVGGVAQFDEAARRRDIFVLSGVSSFPVLTAAVVRHLAQDLPRLGSIAAGIAPSPYAGVGINVIRSIASYAGKPVRLRRGSKDAAGHALTETRRATIAPPGRLPLRNIRFSLVDVPDLQLLPRLWPDVRDVWVGAGPVPEILHRALNALAWLVRAGVLPTLSPFAVIFHHAINLLRWGEHRGGMFVGITGTTSGGAPLRRSWHLLAEGDDGPLIPSMAAEAIVRHCADGRRPQRGARAATGDLELADYEVLFARRTIYTGRREDSAATARWPLYRRILGDAWLALPGTLRAMHDLDGRLCAEGRSVVDRGTGWLARCVAALFRFPTDGYDVPVRVAFVSQGGKEVWCRTFAGRSFMSVQGEGDGRDDRLLVERFGPLSFAMALVVDQGRLHLIVRRWRAFGVPMPLFFAPKGKAFEMEAEGRFNFHVEISHWLTGLIVRYRGWLVPRPD